MPSITLIFKNKVLDEFHVNENSTFAIGRRSANDIVIVNLAVSGYHAEIVPTDRGYLLRDLNSKNGTLLNGRPVKKARLRSGDMITIGKHELIFEDKHSQVLTGKEDTSQNSILFENPNEVIDQTVIIDTAKLEGIQTQNSLKGIIEFPDSGREAVALNKQIITIGKGKYADIGITGVFRFLAGDPAATVSKRPDGYYISAGGGLFKPKVRGKTIDRATRLKSSDTIRIGPLKMRFVLH